MVGLNIGEMLFLIEGAVRQLDRESSDLIQQTADWINEVDQRLNNIEQQL